MGTTFEESRQCSANPRCSHLEGRCCPTAAGIRLLCCNSEEVSEIWAWASLIITATAISVGLISLAVVLPRAPARFRREVSVALTSALVYMLMALPFFAHGLWNIFPARLQENYIWLPFWYAFVLTKTLGSFFEVAACSAKGTLVAVFALVFLNYLLPGGASPYSMTKTALESSWTRWLGTGYHPYVAWIFTACFVYGVFLAQWGAGMKQYALGFFASTIVEFMNPDSPIDSFKTILWDYDFRWNWSGETLTMVYVTLAAIPLAAFSLPIIVPCNRRLRRFFSCRAMASRGLSKVAADTWGSLERLITYFSEDGSHFDTESSFLYIRQLGARRAQMEALLEQAKWECYGKTTRARLRSLNRVAGLLRDLRQGLRVQLEQVQQIRADVAYSYTPEFGPHLIRFLQAMNDGMRKLVSFSDLHRGLTMEDLEHMLASASAADAALVDALNTVPRGHQRESIFIDCLRNFSDALGRFAKDGIAELEEPPEPRCRKFSLWDWSPHHACFIREQHSHAVRNTCSWLLALIWSCMVRRGTCVTTVSFLFSPSLGSLFDRNINRILGVGIGLALGNLPAVLMLKQDCYTDECFLHPNTGPIAYLLLMFAQWAISIYGYLATGSKYSYACLLWAGFSGVQMLRSMHTPDGRNGDMTDSQLFVSTMDNMLGCFIVFGVDIVASNLMASRTTEQVALHVSQCLLNVSDLFGSLKDTDSPLEVSQEFSALKSSIEGSRYWDQEAKKEDFVWTSARLMPYKADLVDAVLKHIDEIYVAAWSLSAAARRSGEVQSVKATFQEYLPAILQPRCRLYSRVLKTSLCERKGHKNKLEDLSLVQDCDEAPSIANDPQGDEEQGSALAVRDVSSTDARADEATAMAAHDVRNAEARVNQTAVLVMRANCCAMRLSLLRIQRLLEEHTFWEAKDWRTDGEESDEPSRLKSPWSLQVARSSMWTSEEEEEDEDEDEDEEEST